MKLKVTLACAASLVMLAQVYAQTPPARSTPSQPQARPDARYPNPSGQDSRPSTTTVKPTPAPPASKAPQDGKAGEASNNTYVNGKKHDASGGCSTPTDAQSAHSSTKPQDAARKARDDRNTVCTTSGENGQSAREPQAASKDSKATDAKQKPASSAPR